jgi:hypothetical protein
MSVAANNRRRRDSQNNHGLIPAVNEDAVTVEMDRISRPMDGQVLTCWMVVCSQCAVQGAL